jgi:hypothetical protein
MKRSAALYLNPSVTLGEMDENDAIHIHAPVRHKLVSRTPIDPVKDQKDFSQLTQWLKNGFPKKITPKDCSKKIYDSGLFLPKNLIPREIRFTCEIEAIEAETKDWVDRDRLILISGKHPENIVVNPSLKFKKDSKGLALLWIKDPFTAFTHPLSLKDYHMKVVTKLIKGISKIEELSTKLLELYLICRILIPRNNKDTQKYYKNELGGIKEQLHKDKYARLPNILSLPQVVHLRNYYEMIIAEGYSYRNGPNEIVQRKCFFKDDSVCRNYIEGYLPFFSQICSKPVRPGVPYLLAYQPGEILQEHRDGPDSSEFTVSIQLYYRNKGSLSQNRWPLFLESKANGGVMEEHMIQAGNGIIFMGQELLHSREQLSKNQKSGIILFSYRDINYAGKTE